MTDIIDRDVRPEFLSLTDIRKAACPGSSCPVSSLWFSPHPSPAGEGAGKGLTVRVGEIWYPSQGFLLSPATNSCSQVPFCRALTGSWLGSLSLGSHPLLHACGPWKNTSPKVFHCVLRQKQYLPYSLLIKESIRMLVRVPGT